MIFIRADANPNIGMGHIMRCLSLADAFRKTGQEIQFVIAGNEAEEVIIRRGYKAYVLNTSYTDMNSELSTWPDCIPDNIIVDSYYVTYNYLCSLRSRSKIIYIDDLGKFPYPVDIVVNYNAFYRDLNYQNLYRGKEEVPTFLLGVEYALLRNSFCGIPSKIQRKKVRNILISTGGSDKYHILLNFLKIHPKGYNYHVVLGAMNQDVAEIKQISESMDNITVHENVDDMKSLICSCDMAVSAAGSTLYEICACGVPLITYIIADNQIPGAEAFEKLGLAVNCGDLRGQEGLETVVERIEDLACNYHRRVKMGLKMQKLIDGRGADRTIGIINKGFPNIIEN